MIYSGSVVSVLKNAEWMSVLVWKWEKKECCISEHALGYK